MKITQLIKQFGGFILLFICSQNALAYAISQQQINDYLIRTRVIEDQFSIPRLLNINYRLQDLRTQIGKNGSPRMEVSGKVDGTLTINNESFPIPLDLTFDTVPYYDATRGQIYLKDIQILHWSSSSAQVQNIMPMIDYRFAELLNQFPVYTLDESKPEELMIKKVAKGIKVAEGQLEIETNLF